MESPPKNDDYYKLILAVPARFDGDMDPRPPRRRRSSVQTTGGPEPPIPTRIIQDVLLINAGEDVVQTILAHFRNIPRPSQEFLGVVLSATGSILNPAISTRLLTKSFEGAFPIAHLTGHFIIKRTGRVDPCQGQNITFRGSDGEMVGGRVEGPLIAATEIQLRVGRFPHEANSERSPIEIGVQPSLG